ncbi:hypothetical protein IBB74_01580 [Listeria welshimeri]|uniref:Imm26 family immunity protein n=1 Tax=Listeria welshimeri TaxID=1643 RepID=UPI0010B3931E|nr:Imm26 family immunity protein [Listeria welshimeri]MBC1707810.1 hypothetical protein [Listeria welshimeri]MBC1782309.1 hypothetical protein [Listeria welshimeri]MBC1863216.1 hypothetical protein [Listeria welshimeri]MBC1950494.1 hypothetical protein [Listeria welshimeri]MBC2356959.1 hypothetical protein [Listeria welshimeri]
MALPDGRFAYGLLFKESIIGIYNIISEIRILLENIINQELKLYKGCNESLIKNGTWSIIGSNELVDEDIYTPDLAYYVEWLPKESVNRLAINRKEKTVIVEKEYYIYLVKKGYTLGTFNKPEQLPQWILEHL